jgi:hypothetical protein
MPDQCALDSSGNLKDAKDITFYESESDDRPISNNSGPSTTQLEGTNSIPQGQYFRTAHIFIFISTLRTAGRGFRSKNTQKLQDSLSAEKLDVNGQPEKPSTQKKHRRRAKKLKTTPKNHPSVSDGSGDDIDFVVSADESTDSEQEELITNQEV